MHAPNRLYFGDCLDVMRENIADESVDLIYLDPPFNSKRPYNAFIGGRNGLRSTTRGNGLKPRTTFTRLLATFGWPTRWKACVGCWAMA